MSDDEREELHALIHLPGWQRVLAVARSRFAGDGYGREIKLAIANALRDKTDVSAAVAAVDASSDAVNQVLSWPADRLRELDKQHEQQVAVEHGALSRRGGL